MLYTRKGDRGTTKIFGCDQRFTKSSAVAEALGAVDELNSFLGLCKINPQAKELFVWKRSMSELIDEVQQNLFIVQADLAGADKRIAEDKITAMEAVIDEIEQTLPPIHSFFVSGGTELSTLFDVARTIARRAERSIVALFLERNETGMSYGQDETKTDEEIPQHMLAYINRLSSLLYAFARLANHKAHMEEAPPSYL